MSRKGRFGYRVRGYTRTRRDVYSTRDGIGNILLLVVALTIIITPIILWIIA